MKLGVLTSSRADYSIYLPLLRQLQQDSFFRLSIIAFGTHLSAKHGYTLERIKEDGFDVAHALKTIPDDDSPEAISRAMAQTMSVLSSVWVNSSFDLVLCLGDRYEMFAACASAMPFNIKLAHIHGGEQSLGAIDDAFRHAITHMSQIHFTAAEPYRERVIQLKGADFNVYNTGSLSIDNLKSIDLLGTSEFEERFGIDITVPSILITFHPETVSYQSNGQYVDELISALRETQGYQFIITMPNADTMGNIVRDKLLEFKKGNQQVMCVESFGTLGYLSCMKYCSFMLGNTSSGYIEASFFPKYVIDLGERQKGRIVTTNIQRCPIEKQAIVNAIANFDKFKKLQAVEIYGNGTAADSIVRILKSLYG